MELMLRKFEKKDIENIALYANNRKIANFLRDDFPHPYKIENAKKYVNGCIEADEYLRFYRAISLNGQAIGSISISLQDQDEIYRKSAEIGYWLGEPYWGYGIMTEAVKQMCKVAFKYYDIERIYAEIFQINVASAKVLTKSGFQLEGILRNSIFKNGKLYNSCIYSILKDEVDFLDEI